MTITIKYLPLVCLFLILQIGYSQNTESIETSIKILILADAIPYTGVYNSSEIKVYLEFYNNIEIQKKNPISGLELVFYQVTFDYVETPMGAQLIYITENGNKFKRPKIPPFTDSMTLCKYGDRLIKICGFYQNNHDLIKEILKSDSSVYQLPTDIKKYKKFYKRILKTCSQK